MYVLILGFQKEQRPSKQFDEKIKRVHDQSLGLMTCLPVTPLASFHMGSFENILLFNYSHDKIE